MALLEIRDLTVNVGDKTILNTRAHGTERCR